MPSGYRTDENPNDSRETRIRSVRAVLIFEREVATSLPSDRSDGAARRGARPNEPVDIQVEMQRSYIDYAMSVIVGRALPDVRDGLKPVHTRILYGMYDAGYRPDRGFFKCSRVVGDVMGNYHPHGDTALYDALVRMAQPWSMRMRLMSLTGKLRLAGQRPARRHAVHRVPSFPAGDGDAAGHQRGHRRFPADYDGRSAEPVVLPARFPNLLINGCRASPSGMATNIPPHNLREVARESSGTWRTTIASSTCRRRRGRRTRTPFLNGRRARSYSTG